ncbi:MAG: protein kinase [Myxococcota bacterium]
MDAARWARVRAVFDAVVELPASEREATLAAACGSDAALRQEVEALLDADEDTAALATAETGPEAVRRALHASTASRLASAGFREPRWIAGGGMGEVWQAFDPLGEPLALKLIHPHLVHAPTMLVRFLREAEAGLAVQDPHVVRTRSVRQLVTEQASVPLLVMDFVPGQTLLDRVSERPLSADALQTIGGQAARGLAAIHAAGYVHRDIKPSNILLGDDGVARVLDLGVARAQAAPHELTRTGQVVGTLVYAAPEQVFDRPDQLDGRADLYALGLTLRFAATGQLPFDGDLPLGALAVQKGERLPSIRETAPQIPEWLGSLLDALVEPAKDARPRDATTVVRCFEVQEAPEPPAIAPLTFAFSGPALPDLPDAGPVVGREVEHAAIATAFAEATVVSLQGTAGTGKTTLAIHYGRSTRGMWPGGVFLCTVADARSEDEVVRALAEGLSVPVDGGTPLDALGAALGHRGRALVIVDPVEHLAEVFPPMLAALRRRAPEARWLVASRQRLDLGGERLVVVEPLALPPANATLAEADQSPAVALFAERARRVHPSFKVEDANVGDVVELVRRLDGLPLALELAAARVRVLPPRKMIGRLERRLDVLARKHATGRNATLRGALDASWDLLRDDERDALALCSLFEGSFDLEAVEAVVDVPGADAIDLIDALVEHSLVRARGERFTLLASIRLFAREKLSEGAAEPARAAHAAHFAAHPIGPADLGNALAAARWAVEAGLPDVAAPAASAALAVLRRVGPFALGVTIAEQVLAEQVSDAPRARLEVDLGELLNRAGDAEAGRGWLEQARERAARLSERELEARALTALGHGAVLRRESDVATTWFEAALPLAQSVGASIVEAEALAEMAHLTGIRGGAYEVPLDQLRRARRLQRTGGDRSGEALTESYLGALHCTHGDLEEGLAAYERSRSLAAMLGDRRTEGLATGMIAGIRSLTGDAEAARSAFGAALAIQRAIGDRIHEGMHAANYGSFLASQGELEAAAAQLEAAVSLAVDVGDSMLEGISLGTLAGVLERSGRGERALTVAQRAEERLRRGGDPLELGKLLCRIGRLSLARGDRVDAEDRLAEARTLADAAELSPTSQLSQDIEELKVALADATVD